MELRIDPLSNEHVEGGVEVVEHKGIGHPDTMCDGFAEAFGAALTRFYLQRFGGILHFNVDKALLCGGRARPAFGGGEVVAPIRVLLGGRATRDHRGVAIPVDELAAQAAKDWVRANLHALDPERHVRWECVAGAGSPELVDLFGAGSGRARVPLANDTSIGVGYAPASRLERAVRAAARKLQALAAARREVGEDVKVMGVRTGDRVDLTVACAFIGRHLRSLGDYAAAREAVAGEVVSAAREACGLHVSVSLNAADDLATGRVYLTVTGTSAESGDDGEVGRGNRINGLITPFRPMSLEAVAGKNPVSHVGKLYNIVAHRMAAAIVDNVAEVAQAECFLLSRIGCPVNEPWLVEVRVRTRDGVPLAAVAGRVGDVAREGVAGVTRLWQDLLEAPVSLPPS